MDINTLINQLIELKREYGNIDVTKEDSNIGNIFVESAEYDEFSNSIVIE